MKFTNDVSKYEAHLFCEYILKTILNRVKSSNLLEAYTELHGTTQATLDLLKQTRISLEETVDTKDMVIYCDGTIFPKDGTIGCGFIIDNSCNDGLSLKDERFQKGTYLGFKGTTNQAEYYGVIEALDYVRQLKTHPVKLTIYTDSNLLVRQVTNQWEVKNRKLRKLKNIIHSLMDEISSVISIEWVAREENLAHNVAQNCKDY